ncbi:MAG TPA: RNA polymerase sigma factor [Terracidiphilus sp.]
MASISIPGIVGASAWSDEEIVRRVLEGDALLFEILMRRHNQRIYRAVRSILRDDSECEDVMQETYVSAYTHLAQFEGRAKFSTWLTRIAVNESIKRANARGRLDLLDWEEHGREDDGTMSPFQSGSPTPEADASRGELSGLLEEAILALPLPYRAVVMLRDLEELSTSETAEALSLTDSNVRVRLHRAHELLREDLLARVGASSSEAFGFHANRCDRVVQAVFARLGLSSGNKGLRNP